MDSIDSMIDVSPDVHFVNSMRNRNLGWEKALAELIDNALDHKANQIKILANNKIVTVIDDGAGVKDLAATVTSGKHVPSDSTELGMFGVGLKDAWHWAGHRMEVETVRDGRKGLLVADSREMIRLGDWKVQSPSYSECGEPSGTKITLHLATTEPRRNSPSRQAYENLAWIFTPALLDGKQIIVPDNRMTKPLKAIALPTFSEVVEDIFTVSGREVYIKIGIVADTCRMVKGPFWIQYGHRNIARKPIGCGNYSADRMGGIIRLKKGDWNLSANKDDLTDYKDELGDAILERIEHLLKKSESFSQELANNELLSELESELNEAIVKAKKTEKEKRPGESTSNGAITSIGTGRKRRTAKVSDPNEDGSVDSIAESTDGKPSRKKRGIYLVFGEFDTPDTLGEYDDFSRRITLNKEHPFVEHLRRNKDMKGALHAIAFSLICHWAVSNQGKQKLLFESEDFGLCFGKVLASLDIKEDEDAKA